MPTRFAAAIVPIAAADLDAAAALLRLTLVESGIEPDVVTERYVAGWIGGGAPLLGARVGPVLVGYAMLERGPGPGDFGVVALSVLQRYRRQGLGEKLMRALLEAVRQAGEIGEVWLSVAPENLPARALYEKLGFTGRADPPLAMFVPAAHLTMLCRLGR